MTLGKSIIRPDILGKITGETRYGGDIPAATEIVARVIRSPYPHAKINKVHTEKAAALPGVLAVYTAKDIAGTNKHGLIFRDQEVFATERVRYMGDALGMIVAETAKIAEKALALIEVDFEKLPIIGDMDTALQSDSFPIHPNGNIMSKELIRKGNIEEGWKQAEVIVEEEFYAHCIDHAFLDVEAGCGYLQDGVLILEAPGQWVHEERRLIALALGLPPEKIRIIQPPTGGAFGGREDLSIQVYLGLAATKLQRLVRIQYTREESMIARHKRHPIKTKYKLGATKEGKFVAAQVEIFANEGAYASTGPAVLRKAASHCTGPYLVPNIKADGIALFTNENPTGAMRGFGTCQMAIAYEGTIYKLAQKLGMDVIELKKRNLLKDGDAITTNQIIPVASIRECLDAVLEKANWENRSYDAPLPHLKRGYGVSAICFGLGYGDAFPDTSRARVKFNQDGQLEVYTGAVEVGQGLLSVMAQIAGHELAIEPQNVNVIAADTLLTPESGSSSATRQTLFTGNAVRLAAKELAREILDIAALYLKLHWEEMHFVDGYVAMKHEPYEKIPISKLVIYGHERGYALDSYAVYQPRTVEKDPKTGLSPRAFITYMFGCQLAEVLVDTETGEVKVQKIIAAHDVGKALNPQQVEGQIEGGVAQGLGMALMEEVTYKNGVMLNPSFTDYIIPTIVDVPEIHSIILERPDIEGPYGARGIGEPPLVGTSPAIFQAISDALGGKIVTESPATAERVWKIIQA